MNRSARKAPRGNTKTIAIVAGALVAVVGGAGIGLALNGDPTSPAPAPAATSAAPPAADYADDAADVNTPEAESPPDDLAAEDGDAPATQEDVQDDPPVASGDTPAQEEQGSGGNSGQDRPAAKPTKKPATKPTQAPQDDPDAIDRDGDAGAVEPGGPIGGY
ncbi:hypothetical protein [Herbidospora daliensis]|uniref:hypothetical protein n=1 Tax=Herbidospora daliensis TaxID=295585 RepID=UPI000782243F|nr:hypothetical protein [Herbidospora daliensis]